MNRNICEDAVDSLFDKLYPRQINLKSFETKKNLNPAIWKNGILRADVRKRLIAIAKEFVETLKIENLPVSDIILVGSSASYNWSKYSDIDLHILVDFSKITVTGDDDFLKNYFTSKKNGWNNTHSHLTLNGYPVELYVQGITEENASNAVYSIKGNYWLKQPVANDYVLDKAMIKNQSANLANRIDDIIKATEMATSKRKLRLLNMIANKLYESIIMGRREGLATEGEKSPDNIVFKVLRRTGHLGKLRQLKNLIFDKLQSL